MSSGRILSKRGIREVDEEPRDEGRYIVAVNDVDKRLQGFVGSTRDVLRPGGIQRDVKGLDLDLLEGLGEIRPAGLSPHHLGAPH